MKIPTKWPHETPINYYQLTNNFLDNERDIKKSYKMLKEFLMTKKRDGAIISHNINNAKIEKMDLLHDINHKVYTIKDSIKTEFKKRKLRHTQSGLIISATTTCKNKIGRNSKLEGCYSDKNDSKVRRNEVLLEKAAESLNYEILQLENSLKNTECSNKRTKWKRNDLEYQNLANSILEWEMQAELKRKNTQRELRKTRIERRVKPN